MTSRGIVYALTAAALFGISTPFAKLLVGASDPWVLAGILYLGAGLGLGLVQLAIARYGQKTEAAVSRVDLPWLAGAVLAGGVVGPILLMVGLARVEASAASLLLTLEGVSTALIAWFVFRENFDRRIAVGMACIVAGAIVLNWRGHIAISELAGPLAIAGACLAWAIDNNLTRKVSLSDPVQIAMIRGLVAGPVSLALGLLTGATLPSWQIIALGGVTGFFGYGLSLTLFVVALRNLGTARTGAYFSVAPFLGAAVSVLLLGEPASLQLVAAGALMAVGVWLHISEQHEHEHLHAELEHEHGHTHDLHHAHAHETEIGDGESHSHAHRHARMMHAHPHTPDSHHHHSH